MQGITPNKSSSTIRKFSTLAGILTRNKTGGTEATVEQGTPSVLIEPVVSSEMKLKDKIRALMKKAKKTAAQLLLEKEERELQRALELSMGNTALSPGAVASSNAAIAGSSSAAAITSNPVNRTQEDKMSQEEIRQAMAAIEQAHLPNTIQTMTEDILKFRYQAENIADSLKNIQDRFFPKAEQLETTGAGAGAGKGKTPIRTIKDEPKPPVRENVKPDRLMGRLTSLLETMLSDDDRRQELQQVIHILDIHQNRQEMASAVIDAKVQDVIPKEYSRGQGLELISTDFESQLDKIDFMHTILDRVRQEKKQEAERLTQSQPLMTLEEMLTEQMLKYEKR